MNRRDLFRKAAALPVVAALPVLLEAKSAPATKAVDDPLFYGPQYGFYDIRTDEIVALDYSRAQRAYNGKVSLWVSEDGGKTWSDYGR